jgi:group I intron endonuclease
MLVYKAKNLINGKVYVGATRRTVDQRFRNHLCSLSKSKLPFHRALKKYGLQSFKITVIDSAETWAAICEKEKYWIKRLKSKVPNGYNLTEGGEGLLGMKRPDIAILLRGKPSLNKGRVMSAAEKKHLSRLNSGKKNPNYGNHLSKAAKKRIGDAQRKRVWTKEDRERWSKMTRGENNPRFGAKLSEKTKKILRLSLKAWREKRRKLGLPIGRPKGIPYTEEQRKQRSVESKISWARRRANGTDGWHGRGKKC